ncbi:hypothetical protein P8452_42653 [Trifolium repens]|nr:hypothetical protein P8452_42653 [Trifolium repens]
MKVASLTNRHIYNIWRTMKIAVYFDKQHNSEGYVLDPKQPTRAAKMERSEESWIGVTCYGFSAMLEKSTTLKDMYWSLNNLQGQQGWNGYTWSLVLLQQNSRNEPHQISWSCAVYSTKFEDFATFLAETTFQAFRLLLTIKRYLFFAFNPFKFNIRHSGGFKSRSCSGCNVASTGAGSSSASGELPFVGFGIGNTTSTASTASFGTEFSFASKASPLAILAVTALAFGKPCFLNWNHVYCCLWCV